jgi:uncharacterized protein YrrD
MLQLSKALTNVAVMSLRTGGQIGTALKPIINPNNLKLEGWYVTDRFSKKTMILLSQEVRDIIPRGIIVDDHDAMTEPGEILRLQDIIRMNFELIGKKVVSDHKRSLGKLSDFATDMDSLFVQKLYVEQSMLRHFASGQLSIDRSQIVEITDKRIVVREATEKMGSPAPAPAAM